MNERSGSVEEAKTAVDRFKVVIATCFGFGYSPILPGTCGALWGIAIYVPLGLWVPEPWQSIAIAAALIISCAVTVWLAPWAERYFDEKDSGIFVTDEVAGFLLTVLLFRVPDVWITVLWAFPITRIIDIIKVPPAKQLEKWPAGWGVLADDLLGSIYAAGVCHLLCLAIPSAFGL